MGRFDGFRRVFTVKTSYINNQGGISEAFAGALATNFSSHVGISLGSDFSLYLEFSQNPVEGEKLSFREVSDEVRSYYGFLNEQSISQCSVYYDLFAMQVSRHLPQWLNFPKINWYQDAPWILDKPELVYQMLLWGLDLARGEAPMFDIKENPKLNQHEGLLSGSQLLSYFCESVKIEVNLKKLSENISPRRYWGELPLCYILRVDQSKECAEKALRRYQVSYFRGNDVFSNITFDLSRKLRFSDAQEFYSVDLDLQPSDT